MLNVILALLIYGVFHSLTAAIGFKALMATVMGERGYLGLYRLFYNTISVITLLPVLVLVAAEPGDTVWSLNGIPALFFRFTQVVGLLGLTVSFLQIDGSRFLGLKQMAVYFSGGKLPLPPEPMVFNGVYAVTRHPLYLFSMLVLWFQPQMNEALFGFNIGATIYFCLGSLVE